MELDPHGRCLCAALAAVLVRDKAPELRLVHDWLDSWSGIGLIIARMTHQGWDVQTDRLRGARLAADVLPVGTAHSVVAGSHGRSGGRQIEDAFRMLVDRYDSMVQDGRREFYGSPASPARGQNRLRRAGGGVFGAGRSPAAVH